MKVLFATDGSPSATAAAHYLTRLQFKEPLNIILLTVSYDPRTANPNAIQPWFPEWLEHESTRIEADHQSLEKWFADRCASVTSVHRTGHVATTILDESQKHHVDLIVMGARGHSLLSRLLLGSVSDDVATRAECSILIVRPGQEKQKHLRHLMLAYDASTPSRDAISEILDLDWDPATNLSLLSVAPVYNMMMGEGLSMAVTENQQEVFEHMQQVGQDTSAEIASLLPRTQSIVEQSEHAGEAIVAATEKHGSDMVVIGDAGHNLLHDVFLGSTTKYVLRHAPCSVWISRRHRKAEDSRASTVGIARQRDRDDNATC